MTRKILLIIHLFLLFSQTLCADGGSSSSPSSASPSSDSGGDKPAMWLTRPESRLAEREPGAKRLPEAMCPTRRSQNDVRSSLQSGAITEVQWRFDDAPAKKMRGGDVAKIELLAAESNSILARLDTVAAATNDGDSSATVKRVTSKLVKIPEDFDCRECILRLTIDVDAQSQIVSCADVQISPRNSSSSAVASDAECSNSEDCGHGECYNNLCYCSSGFYGPHCANDSRHTSQLAAEVESSKYHAFTFPTQGQFLWRVDEAQNAIEMALRVPRASVNDVSWYVLGVRPEDDASKTKCIRMMTGGGASVSNSRNVSNRVGSATSENSVQVDTPSVGVVPVAPPKTSEASKNNLNIKKITANLPNESESGCAENETWNTCPEYSRECEPSCDWTAFPESIPSCPKACGEPRCVCREGFVRAANDRNECRPFDFCQASEVLRECARNETWAKCGTACEPSCESMYNVEPCTSTCQTPECTCADNYVRFKGECIFWANCPHLEERFLSSTGSASPTVIGTGGTRPPLPKAPKRTSKIQEETSTASTSNAQSTAQKTDASAFVTDALSNKATADVSGDALNCAANETRNECGRVCEPDCVTIFERAECAECGMQSECACKQGFARHTEGHCVYWNDCPIAGFGRADGSILAQATPTTTTTKNAPALTTTTTKMSKTTTTTIERGESTATVEKKEGNSTTIAASLDLAPVVLHDCFGEWVWPKGCTMNCDYKISWIYAPETDLIDFALEAKMAQNTWTGIGFAEARSSKANANKSDDGAATTVVNWIVVKSQHDGLLSLHNMHTEGNESFVEDASQSATPTDAKLGTHEKGILRAAFSQKRSIASNATGASFAEGQCHRLLFPVSGGRVQPEDGSIFAAQSPPHATTSEICIRACPQQAPKQTSSATSDAPVVSSTRKAPTAVAYSCQTEYRYPDKCASEACEYRARWKLEPQRGDVEFEISARGIGRWTGVGFSPDGQMSNSDMYTGWVYDHRAYVTDRFAYDRQMPVIDASNDVYNVTGSLKDDVQTISFRRKVVTADNTTDYALDRCWHFLFPVGGGRVMARQGDDFRSADTPIGYHDQAPPKFSTRKICLCVDGVPLASEVDASEVVATSDDEVPVFSSNATTTNSLGENNKTSKKKLRRVRRQIEASATAADDAFVCADMALVELRDGGAKVRVGDAFSFSKRSVQADDFSFSDVSAQVEGDTLIVLLKKPLTANETNDFSIANGPATVFLGSGKGAVDYANAPIELTRVNLAHPEMNVVVVPQKVESTTETSVASAADDFNTANSNGPFDVSSARVAPDSETPTQAITEDVTPGTTITTNGETTAATSVQPESIISTAGAEPRSSSSTVTVAPTIEKQDVETTTSERPVVESARPESMDENCFGTFHYPQGCQQTVEASSSSACQYTIQWMVNGVKKSVDFWLSATMATEQWTGVGFSPDGTMSNADVIIVSVLKDASITVMDQFSFSYGRPRIDKMQDVFNADTVYRDGRVYANFSRNLNTGDAEDDVDLLSQCQRFIFLHAGGALEGGSEQIRKHFETPIVSRAKVCLGKCGLIESMTTMQAATEVSKMPTELHTTLDSVTPTSADADEKTKLPTRVEVPEKKKKPDDIVLLAGAGQESDDGTATVGIPPSRPESPNHLYDVVIRLMGEKWSHELEDTESERFSKLATRLKNTLTPAISARWPSSLASVRVTKFAEGSVLALLQIEFDGEHAPSEAELKDFLKELVVGNSESAVEALKIDSDAMQVRENTQMDLEDKWGPLRDFGMWLIVGAVLILCAVVCALCFACICRRRSNRHKTSKTMHSFSPHYAYQFTSPGYPTGITNAAYVGGISSSKDTDMTKLTGNGGSGSSSVSSTTAAGGKKNGVDKSPRTPKVGAGTEPSSINGAADGAQSSRADYPRGMGETTYQEWFAKVASKDASSHYQESAYATPPIRRQPGSAMGVMTAGTPLSYTSPAVHHHQHHQSYVTYPNDPGSYYTLNGEHKLPPPSYYHRH